MQLRLLGVGSGHNLWVLMPKAITSESKNKHGDHIKRESYEPQTNPRRHLKEGVCAHRRGRKYSRCSSVAEKAMKNGWL